MKGIIVEKDGTIRLADDIPMPEPGPIEMMTSGRLNPATMLTHIGGLNAVVDTTLNLPNIKGGKKLIYTQIELPLTAIADFEKLGESDPLFAKLAEITARHNGLWSPEAEKYLLQAKA